jgi:hypothetical protein
MSRKKAAPRLWFKTVRQVHQYLTCPNGEEFLWGEGDTAIKDGLVFSVSEKTVYNHTDNKNGEEKLKRTRAGTFAKGTVDRYAKTHLGKVVEGADPAEEDEGDMSASQTGASRRVLADAKVKEIDAQLKTLALKEKMGQMCETAVIERELGQRMQAVKLNFSSFMRDTAPELLSFVGGDLDVARHIIKLCGGDEDRAEAVSGYIFSRKPYLLDAFKRRLVDALNAFAQGTWFTDEMREAWERLEAARHEEEHVVMADLVRRVGGDLEKVVLVMEAFDVRNRVA